MLGRADNLKCLQTLWVGKEYTHVPLHWEKYDTLYTNFLNPHLLFFMLVYQLQLFHNPLLKGEVPF